MNNEALWNFINWNKIKPIVNRPSAYREGCKEDLLLGGDL
jgi:hypothetical protein